MLNQELLNILACPICKNELTYISNSEKLICKNCKKAYPVKDGIPVMLEDEAESLED